MGEKEITIKRQWDAVEAAQELDKLEHHVIDFISHTMNTMSSRQTHETAFGSVQDEHITHPMTHFFASIDACRDGVYRRYGEDLYKQGRLFSAQFNTDQEDEDE